ncbi:hypothetical protein NFI96_002414 [Prochilodus magdalenae]|nr:hypothetical protein NFI96_002414 [Prochilodus magdalenae]
MPNTFSINLKNYYTMLAITGVLEFQGGTLTLKATVQAEPIVQVDGKPSCCFFKFSPKLMFTKVLKAQLWVYLRPLQQTSTVYLQILRLKPVTDQGSRHIRIRSLKIELNSRSGYWQSIDFKHVLQNWFKQPHTNWGIDINAFDESGNDLAVTSLRPGEEGLPEHPHTVPADGAVGVEVEGHQVFWTCDNKPFILVLTTVPPHTDSLVVSTKTKAGLVTEDDPLPF